MLLMESVLFKEESFGGATECTPCSSGSAATPQLTSVVAAMDANEQQLFGLVDASMELQGSLGSLTFQASCATIPQVNFTVEVKNQWIGEGSVYETVWGGF